MKTLIIVIAIVVIFCLVMTAITDDDSYDWEVRKRTVNGQDQYNVFYKNDLVETFDTLEEAKEFIDEEESEDEIVYKK
jgi:hypothetical protein